MSIAHPCCFRTAIAITVAAFNLFGNGLRCADPRLMRGEVVELKRETAGHQDLVVHYETEDAVIEAVNNVSFEVKRGEILGIVERQAQARPPLA